MPELHQWMNRFIEFMDDDKILLAVEGFSELVKSGCEPEEAFEVMINEYRSVRGVIQ